MEYIQERQSVLDVARAISLSGMVIGTWGNVSIRIPDQPLIMITPSGKNYQTMALEDIVLLDLSGQVVDGKWKPSTESPLHLAIYRNRHDAGAIVHVHSPYATAFAAARQSIPVILEETAGVIGHEILTAPYARAGSSEVATNAVRTLGEGKALLLANHGLVGVGKNAGEALLVCQIAEETARVALLAHSLGQVHSLTPAEVSGLHRDFQTYGQKKL
jgi:L-ribulose-5-phosphate 4-epimerase